MSSDEPEKIPQLEYFQRLKQLQGMGFSNDDAADALHEANFDMELAVQYLTEVCPPPPTPLACSGWAPDSLGLQGNPVSHGFWQGNGGC
ncbi:predicted protein [Verticillium alfalfae VaMs.102]|uniref:Predicted protein n=2 Tax=Verticillium TaxID=1036719 RepID=C9SGV9_VERA1|nr:predicted protein [Verticillium alfalfae VaMs.102]EEY17581.1 predicted protein [Verticillium alfalfae VaMs.102]